MQKFNHITLLYYMFQKELTFMEAVKKVYLKNYCNFSGRASRSEFWWAYLAQYAASMVLCFILYIFMGIIIFATMATSQSEEALTLILMLGIIIPMGIFSLALLLPTLGATVRRLHDTGRSGWYYLISFIPLIGGLILIYWLALPSEMCDNRYGPVPNLESVPWENNTNSTFAGNKW